MAFCMNCGSKLDEDAKFCVQCGARQDAGAGEAPVPPPAPERDSGADSVSASPPPVMEAPPPAAFQQPVYVPPPPQPAQQQFYAPPAAPEPGAWQYFVRAFEKQSVFSGRARRSEFWFFALFIGLIQIGVAILVSLAKQNLYDGESNIIEFLINCAMPYFLFCAVTFMPGLAVAIRRMHDCGKSGWYLLIPVYGWIVLPCTAGTPGPNQYGPDPKQNGN